MKQTILIAGSGKMAWNIGDSFLNKGFSVHWLTSSPEQKDALLHKIAKARRRTATFFPERLERFDAGCHLLNAADIPLPDILIESTHESLSKKREVFASLSHLITEQTLIFSNSSSLLPQTLHSNCLGAHFFYPVQLTALVELILPRSCGEERRRQSLNFLQENGLDVLEEDVENAFLVNRLLIPLQAACLRALQDGYPAPVVEEASKSEMIALGQLSMMDAIGLDLIHSAVCNYRNLPESVDPADQNIVISGLTGLLSTGKKGKKNGDGLLRGDALPWPVREVGPAEQQHLRGHLCHTLRQTCMQEYGRKNITLDQLQMICERIFMTKDFPRTFFTEPTGDPAGTGNDNRHSIV